MFLAGGRVKGGLIGEHPSLSELENGGQKHRIDFRRVYAAVLERWLGLESAVILGGRYTPLDVAPDPYLAMALTCGALPLKAGGQEGAPTS